VLTKVDGTARGGIVLAVREELGVPVRFLGTGEGLGDLQPFRAGLFADRILAS
jgi:fused signal recognition particle receptor